MNNPWKRPVAALLAVLLLIGNFILVMPNEGMVKVKAAEGDRCGDNMTWDINADGTLTVGGVGAMWDWSDCLSDSDAPWKIYCEDIKEISISDGVTQIADRAFFGCGSVTSISIPDSVIKIGESAFNGCNTLDDVYYYGTEKDWGNISIADFNAPLLNANIHCVYDIPVSETETTLDDTAVSADDDIVIAVTPTDADDTADAVISDSSFADVDDEFVTETVPDIYTEDVTTEGETVEVPATYITLDKASLSVDKGETAKLTAAVTPADSTDTVVWTSSNNAVATVSDGTVTAVAVGTCAITATAGSVKATCTVTVIDSGILPAPSTVTAARASINSIKVTWSAVSGAGGYYVYRSTDGENFSRIKTLAAKVKTFTDTKLTCGKTYYYKVSAYSKTKVTGTLSEAKGAKPYPNTPSMSSVKRSSNYKIEIKWGGSIGATGYRLYRSANGGEYKLIKTTKTRSYTDSGVVPGVTYSYKVTAYKGSGESKRSTAKSCKTKLFAPGSFKATQYSVGKIKLTWGRVTGATGYKVYRYDKASDKYTCIATLEGNNKRSYINSGLKDRTTYKYKVYAYRTAGGLTGLGTATSIKSAKTATPAGAINVIGALAELRVKFPDGKYWNHVGSKKQNINGYTSSPCPVGHKGNCNGGQCAGFAAKLGVDIFETAAYSWGGKRYSNTKWSSIKSKICIGDIIRINGRHSIVVTGIEGDNIYIADCNWNSRCRISWDRFFTTSRYIKTVTFVYHNPKNMFKSSDSTLYLRGDFSDTIGKITVNNPDTDYKGPLTNDNDIDCYGGDKKYKNGVKVRASASSSAKVVGIPVHGDVYYCYDKKDVDGETWYKIKLDTVSGWINENDAVFTAS